MAHGIVNSERDAITSRRHVNMGCLTAEGQRATITKGPCELQRWRALAAPGGLHHIADSRKWRLQLVDASCRHGRIADRDALELGPQQRRADNRDQQRTTARERGSVP